MSNFQITGRKVLIAMLAFFGVIIAVDSVMMYQAISTFGGIETADSYRKGVAYNQRIAQDAAQDALGWKQDVTLDASTGTIAVTLTDRNGKGVEGLAISVILGRPATDAFDTSSDLIDRGNGRHEAAVPNLQSGTWVVAVSARPATTPNAVALYQSKARIWKPS